MNGRVAALFFLGLLTSGPAPVSAQAPPASLPAAGHTILSPRNANYSIDVRLDPARRTLTGRETLEWRNISSTAATELQFHLYYNAWRDARSTFIRERRLGSATSAATRSEDWSSIDVSSIRIIGSRGGAPQASDLTTGLHYIAPDDGNADDRTVMTVPLPQPIEPGQTVTVEIAWTSKVPRTFARTGAIGNFFFFGQWFPKIGVLENTGWNCHQFHSTTEFFADYGVYDVRMTVPRGWPIGATGVERERRDNPDGTTTHRYYQEDVHDFAWTTSPNYLERRARFEHAGLPPVDMRLLLQPEHFAQAERHFDATRAALRYYGEWFGAYPYGHITIIDPAWQSGADGMEYPTLFTAGTSWLAPWEATSPEDVTVHEAGHQFWYSIVGSNEFEDAWMDEGINTFSTARVSEQAFGRFKLSRRYFGGFVPYVFRDIPWSRVIAGDRLASYRSAPTSDVQGMSSFRYFPGAGARAITYAKTALWLHTLERALGWPTMQKIMSSYFDRWQFRHPKPDDFFRIAREVSGVNLTPFFDQVYRASAVFDYGVQSLTSERDGQRYRTNVVVRRYGDGIFPVDVLVTFADGQQVHESWDGQNRWKLFTFDRPSRAASAQVDPGRVLLLDVNFTNNSKSLAPKSNRAAAKWTLKWMVWLEDLLLTWAFFI